MATTAAVSLDEAKAELVLRQVEFYFSDSYLPRDGCLRKTVEESEDGLVSLALICSFAKMKSHLGLDATVKEDSVPEDTVLAVAKVLRCSLALRVSEDGKKVGRANELLKPDEIKEQVDSRSIAVSPLPYDVKLEDVQSFFTQYGKVNSVRLPKHLSDKRLFCGTALVEFSEEEAANGVMKNNLIFAGADLEIKPKKEFDAEREAKKEAYEKSHTTKNSHDEGHPEGLILKKILADNDEEQNGGEVDEENPTSSRMSLQMHDMPFLTTSNGESSSMVQETDDCQPSSMGTDYFMKAYYQLVAKRKEQAAEEKIRNKLQLIPFQYTDEYMHEYYRLHPHQEETELTRSVKEEMEMEEKVHAEYRMSKKGAFVSNRFETNTTLSPMYFTHCTPGIKIKDDFIFTTGASLQIFSFEIAEIKGDLKWPLYVYGVVAARDEVDHNRNLLFKRTRDNAQQVTQNDPFLRLTGPVRAILPELEFEVELRIKGRTKSGDRALINKRYPYIDRPDGLYTIPFWNCLCRCELRLEQLGNSVQATILGVRIVEGGPPPFKYGGRVVCSSPPEAVIVDNKGVIHEVTDPKPTQVVLVDSHFHDGGKIPMGTDGYIDLTRRVVSVELRESHVVYPEKLEETFRVVMQAYSESGHVAAQGHVNLAPKLCNISQVLCDIGDSQVEITVAWSVHVAEKLFL